MCSCSSSVRYLAMGSVPYCCSGIDLERPTECGIVNPGGKNLAQVFGESGRLSVSVFRMFLVCFHGSALLYLSLMIDGMFYVVCAIMQMLSLFLISPSMLMLYLQFLCPSILLFVFLQQNFAYTVHFFTDDSFVKVEMQIAGGEGESYVTVHLCAKVNLVI